MAELLRKLLLCFWFNGFALNDPTLLLSGGKLGENKQKQFEKAAAYTFSSKSYTESSFWNTFHLK